MTIYKYGQIDLQREGFCGKKPGEARAENGRQEKFGEKGSSTDRGFAADA
jgi:hypothetical protein